MNGKQNGWGSKLITLSECRDPSFKVYKNYTEVGGKTYYIRDIIKRIRFYITIDEYYETDVQLISIEEETLLFKTLKKLILKSKKRK